MLDSISESIDIWSQGQLHLYLREAEEKEPDLAVLQNLDRLLSGKGGSFGVIVLAEPAWLWDYIYMHYTCPS